MSEVTFTVSGTTMTISAGEVRRKLSGMRPGSIREHAVEVDGMLYPVKEAFGAATGLDVLDFNTNQARSVLKRLGFRVIRV